MRPILICRRISLYCESNFLQKQIELRMWSVKEGEFSIETH